MDRGWPRRSPTRRRTAVATESAQASPPIARYASGRCVLGAAGGPSGQSPAKVLATRGPLLQNAPVRRPTRPMGPKLDETKVSAQL
eukprot:11523616-Alexandrium_andersonii.AAC.1